MKIKKIITALGENKLNCRLRKECIYEVIGDDIPYQDGVLDILKGNSLIETIILSDLLVGEYTIKEFICKIKKINENIEIICFISKEDENLEIFLKSCGISQIYFDNKNTLDEIIDKMYVNEQKNNLQDEIDRLKRLLKKKKFEDKGKIIAISGNSNSGKSIITALIAITLKKLNFKILMIDLDKNNSGLRIIFNNYREDKIIRIYNNLFLFTDYSNDNLYNLKEEYDFILIDVPYNLDLNKIFFEEADKIIFLTECNILEIEKSLFNLKYLKKLKIKDEKINILINKENKYSVEENIVKKVFKNFKIIGKIKYKSEFTNYINSNLKCFIDTKQFANIIKAVKE